MSVSVSEKSVEPATPEWWLLLIWGVASLIVGGSLLVQPVASATTLLAIVASVWFIGGIVELIATLFRRGPSWGWRLAGAVLNIVVALLVLAHPLLGTVFAVGMLYLLVAVTAAYSGLTALFSSDNRSLGRTVLSVLQLAMACAMLVGYFDVLNLVAFVQALGLLMIGGGVVVAVSAFHFKSVAAAHV